VRVGVRVVDEARDADVAAAELSRQAPQTFSAATTLTGPLDPPPALPAAGGAVEQAPRLTRARAAEAPRRA
jgi:hypothetical protein